MIGAAKLESCCREAPLPCGEASVQALSAMHMHEVWMLVACTCALYLPPAKYEYVSMHVKSCLYAPTSEHYAVKVVNACCHQWLRPCKPVFDMDLVSEYAVLQVLNTMA